MIPFGTTAPAAAMPAATMILIVANVAVFFVQLGLPGDEAARFLYTYALVPAVYGHPDLARQAGLDPDNYWPLLSNTFLHAGYLHLIVNMWTLWLFGAPLEGRLGRWRFLGFYLVCGAAGSLGHLAFNLDSRIPALGASGAIAGVLGGYTWLFPRARVAVVQPIFLFPLVLHLPAVLFTGLWFAVQVLQGTAELAASQGGAMGGIAWWAHIGGFVAGLAAVMVFGGGGRPGAKTTAHRPRRRWRIPNTKRRASKPGQADP